MAAGPSAPASSGAGPQDQLRLLFLGSIGWCLLVVAYAAYHTPEAPLASPELIAEQYERRMRNIPVPAESPQFEQYRQYYKQQYEHNMQEYKEYLEQWKKSQPQFNWGVLVSGICHGGMIFAALLAYLEYHCGAISFLMEVAEAVYNSMIERWADYRERSQKAAMEKLLREMGEAAGGQGKAGASGSAAAKRTRKKPVQELERTSSSSSAASTTCGSSAPSTAASTPAAPPAKAMALGERPEPEGRPPAHRPQDALPPQTAATSPAPPATASQVPSPTTPPPKQQWTSPEVDAHDFELPAADAVKDNSVAECQRGSDTSVCQRLAPETAKELPAGEEDLHQAAAVAADAGSVTPAKQHLAGTTEEAAGTAWGAALAPVTFTPAQPGSATAAGVATGVLQRPVEGPALNARERLRRKMSERTRQQTEQQAASASKPASCGAGAGATARVAPFGARMLHGAELLREAEELLSQLEAQELLRQLEAEERKTPSSQKRKAKRKAAAAAKDGSAEAAQVQEPSRSADTSEPEKHAQVKKEEPPQAKREVLAQKREKSPEATPEVVEEQIDSDKADEEKSETVVEAPAEERSRPEVVGEFAEALQTEASTKEDEDPEESDTEDAEESDSPAEQKDPEATPAPAPESPEKSGSMDASEGARSSISKWADMKDESDEEDEASSPWTQTPTRPAANSGMPRKLPPAPAFQAPSSPSCKEDQEFCWSAAGMKAPRLPEKCFEAPLLKPAISSVLAYTQLDLTDIISSKQGKLISSTSGEKWRIQEPSWARRLPDVDRERHSSSKQPAPEGASPSRPAVAAAAGAAPPARPKAEARRSWADIAKWPEAGSCPSSVSSSAKGPPSPLVAELIRELHDSSIDEILDWFQANDAQQWLFERAWSVGTGKEDLLGLARELVEEQLQQAEQPRVDRSAKMDEVATAHIRQALGCCIPQSPDAKASMPIPPSMQADAWCGDGLCDDTSKVNAAWNLRAEAPEFVPAPKEESMQECMQESMQESMHECMQDSMQDSMDESMQESMQMQMMPVSPCGNFMCVQGAAPQMMPMQAVQVFAIPVHVMPEGGVPGGMPFCMGPMLPPGAIMGMSMPTMDTMDDEALQSVETPTDAEGAENINDTSIATPTESDVEEAQDKIRSCCSFGPGEEPAIEQNVVDVETDSASGSAL